MGNSPGTAKAESYNCLQVDYLLHAGAGPGLDFFGNLLMATAARVVEAPGDSSSEDNDEPFVYSSLASMELVRHTLAGIAARSDEDGAEGKEKDLRWLAKKLGETYDVISPSSAVRHHAFGTRC